MQTFERNLNNLKGNNTGKFYMMKAEGTYVLRVLPPYSAAGVWYKEMREYCIEVGGGFKFLTAPYGITNDPDPIFMYRRNLIKEGASKDDALVKNLGNSTRYLLNVVVLASPDQSRTAKDGVVVIKVPKKVKDQLLQFDTDGDAGYADITSLTRGFNIVIKKSGQGVSTTYQVMPQRERTNLADILGKEGIDLSSWELVNLDEALNPATTQELQEVLDAVIGAQTVPTPAVDRSWEAFKQTVGTVSTEITLGGNNEMKNGIVNTNQNFENSDGEILKSIQPPNVEV